MERAVHASVTKFGRVERIQGFWAMCGFLGVVVANRLYQLLDHSLLLTSLVLFFLPFGIQAYLRRQRAPYHTHPLRNLDLPLRFFSGPLIVAVLMLANGALDSRQPQIVQSTVSRKCVSGVRWTTYSIEVPSWRRNGTESFDVNLARFRSLRRGCPVSFELHPGLIGLAWINHVQPVGLAASAQ